MTLPGMRSQLTASGKRSHSSIIGVPWYSVANALQQQLKVRSAAHSCHDHQSLPGLVYPWSRRHSFDLAAGYVMEQEALALAVRRHRSSSSAGATSAVGGSAATSSSGGLNSPPPAPPELGT